MKFQLAVNLERLDDSLAMDDVARHTLEMVQMAEDGGFNIVWAAEHHALEMTIAPNPFQILTWWASETSKVRLGTAVVNAAYWHPIKLAGEAAFLDLISGAAWSSVLAPELINVSLTECDQVCCRLMDISICKKCCRQYLRCGRAIMPMTGNIGIFQPPPLCQSHFRLIHGFGWQLDLPSRMITLLLIMQI